MEYKISSFKFRNNNIRVLQVVGHGRVYWCFNDIVDAAESEDMLYIFDDKICNYSKLFRTSDFEFELINDMQTIELNDEYSYMFNGGNTIEYIPSGGLIFITSNQVEYLLDAEDNYATEFKWWYKLHTGELSESNVESHTIDNFEYKPRGDPQRIYCINNNTIYENYRHVLVDLYAKEGKSPRINKIKEACETGKELGGYFLCYLSEFENYIEDFEE